MLFGPGTDRRQPHAPPSGSNAAGESDSPCSAAKSDVAPADPSQPRSEAVGRKAGHGRKAAAAYTGAQVVVCRQPALKQGAHCPDPYCRGQLYRVASPAIFIQLTGQPLVGATKFEQEVLRCSA